MLFNVIACACTSVPLPSNLVHISNPLSLYLAIKALVPPVKFSPAKLPPVCPTTYIPLELLTTPVAYVVFEATPDSLAHCNNPLSVYLTRK